MDDCWGPTFQRERRERASTLRPRPPSFQTPIATISLGSFPFSLVKKTKSACILPLFQSLHLVLFWKKFPYFSKMENRRTDGMAEDVFPMEVWSLILDAALRDPERVFTCAALTSTCVSLRNLALPAFYFLREDWVRCPLLTKAVRQSDSRRLGLLQLGRLRYSNPRSWPHNLKITPPSLVAAFRRAVVDRNRPLLVDLFRLGFFECADHKSLLIAARRGWLWFLRWRHSRGDSFPSTFEGSSDRETLEWFAALRLRNEGPRRLCQPEFFLNLVEADDPGLLSWAVGTFGLAHVPDNEIEHFMTLVRRCLCRRKLRSLRWLLEEWTPPGLRDDWPYCASVLLNDPSVGEAAIQGGCVADFKSLLKGPKLDQFKGEPRLIRLSEQSPHGSILAAMEFLDPSVGWKALRKRDFFRRLALAVFRRGRLQDFFTLDRVAGDRIRSDAWGVWRAFLVSRTAAEDLFEHLCVRLPIVEFFQSSSLKRVFWQTALEHSPLEILAVLRDRYFGNLEVRLKFLSMRSAQKGSNWRPVLEWLEGLDVEWPRSEIEQAILCCASSDNHFFCDWLFSKLPSKESHFPNLVRYFATRAAPRCRDSVRMRRLPSEDNLGS